MRKTRKTAAVVALYTFLMLGSVSVVRADQPYYPIQTHFRKVL